MSERSAAEAVRDEAVRLCGVFGLGLERMGVQSLVAALREIPLPEDAPDLRAPLQSPTMRETLEWYAEQVESCRKNTHEGDAARRALDQDCGRSARAALAALPSAKAREDELFHARRQADEGNALFNGIVGVLGAPPDTVTSSAAFVEWVRADLARIKVAHRAHFAGQFLASLAPCNADNPAAHAAKAVKYADALIAALKEEPSK